MLEVGEGKLDMSMTSPAIYTFMEKGTRMYAKVKKAPELAKNLRLIFWFPYGNYHIAVYADSGIETIEDIKGKKVFLGPPGGGAWNASNQIIHALTGYKPNKDYDNVKASWSSAFQGFQDRQFDVYITGCIDPCPQFEQITVTSTLRFLGATAADQDRLNKAIVPGRFKGVIKKNAYGDKQANAQDIYTVGAIVGVTVRHDLPEETVYAITKTFWDGVKAERANTPWLSDITLDFALQKGPMPLHAGAFQYYEEIGLKVPAMNRP